MRKWKTERLGNVLNTTMTKTPNFFVGYPSFWINKRPWLHEDSIALYDTLQRVLKEEGYPFKLGKIKTAPTNHDIVLAHHTTITRKNVWNLKKGYIPGYMYWDRTGYSGWADIANSRSLYEESQSVDLETAASFFNNFSARYIASDKSKFPQTRMSGRATTVMPDKGKFSPPNKYIFVACQRPRDTVSKLAKIKTQRLPVDVVNAFRGSEYKVVIKRHPQEKEMDVRYLAKESHVIFSQHSIHKIIPNATAVITVNSGVGFEALLHKKLVYTSGHCDYHWVTKKLNNARDVMRMVHDIETPHDSNPTIKFMYYMLNEYFVNANDVESVRKKVNMCVAKWKGK